MKLKYLDSSYAIIMLALLSIILRIFFAHLDPFLHEWDERFHALVAKNLMDSPFLPTLRVDPIVPYDMHSWCCNYIWLHKQPLFMWQMALSMKIFGVSEFSIRYPSVIMGTIMVLITYRIAFILTADKFKSLVSALLLCFSHYQLEQTSGLIGMDHNDIAFGFYILLSIWAYCEYCINDKTIWAIVVGFFSGLAIMNKWLVGLLVFLPWGIVVLKDFWATKDFNKFKDILFAIIICCIVFLPWQLSILSRFNSLAIYEYNYNTKHLWEAVEGHSGNIFFYIMHFPSYFGRYTWPLVVVGMYLVFKNKTIHKKDISFALAIMFVFAFAFFSFLVQSKLPSYFFIVAPIGFIYLSIGICHFLQRAQFKILKYSGIALCLFVMLNPIKSYSDRQNNVKRDNLIYNTTIYKKVRKLIPSDCNVVINTNSFEDIDVMFYNDNITAYHWWVDIKELSNLAEKRIKIATFKNHGDYSLPAEYSSYPYLYTIESDLK